MAERYMSGVKKQDGYSQPYMSPAVQGAWVRYEDHLKALRTLASRCESEAIEAAGDEVAAGDAGDPIELNISAGRKHAFNTMERWIDELLGEKEGGDS